MRRRRVQLDVEQTYQRSPAAAPAAQADVDLDSELASLLAEVDEVKKRAHPDGHIVLGEIPGAEGWLRVRNGDSSSTYYWHASSGKVSLEPPPASAAKLAQEEAGAAADAQAPSPLQQSPQDAVAQAEATARHLASAAGPQLDAVAGPARLAIQAQLVASLLTKMAAQQQQHGAGEQGAAGAWGTVQEALCSELEALAEGRPAEALPAQVPQPAATALSSWAAEGDASAQGFASEAGARGSGSDMDLEDGELAAVPPPEDTEHLGPGQRIAELAAGSGHPTPTPAVYFAAAAPPLPPESESELPQVPLAGGGAAASKRKGGGRGASSRKAKAPKLAKGAASLINKWNAMHKERQTGPGGSGADSDDGDAAAAAAEERRLREAEGWRLAQLHSGATADNANFAPLAGDWRDRVKAKGSRRSAMTAKGASASPAPDSKPAGDAAAVVALTAVKPAAAEPTAAGPPDLDVLSSGLPEGWRAMWDAKNCLLYYGNLLTKDERDVWRLSGPNNGPSARAQS